MSIPDHYKYPVIDHAIQKTDNLIEVYDKNHQLMFTLNGYLYSYTYNTVLARPQKNTPFVYVYDFEGGIRGQRSVDPNDLGLYAGQ